jgi:short-subunit dehydrogenase
MNLDGKVVLITGASEGIGAACVHALRQKGALLSITARSEERLSAVGGADALVTAGDLTQEETRGRVVQRTLERFGRIDVLINNAGLGIYWPAWNAPLTETRRMFELNFFVPLAMAQAVIPQMQAQRSGAIVNVGSIAGKITLPWMTLYSSSKFALGALTAGLRMELKPFGIHAMEVCPGYVTTDFQRHASGPRPPEKVVKGRRFAILSEECAAAIVRGIERNARTVVTPRIGWLFIALEHLFPSLYEKQMSSVAGSGRAAP